METEDGTEIDFYESVQREIVKRRTKLPGRVSFYDAVKRAERLMEMTPWQVQRIFCQRLYGSCERIAAE